MLYWIFGGETGPNGWKLSVGFVWVALESQQTLWNRFESRQNFSAFWAESTI